MIDNNTNPVEWALLPQELDDARQHLGQLIDQMAVAGEIDEVEYRVQRGHVYRSSEPLLEWSRQHLRTGPCAEGEA